MSDNIKVVVKVRPLISREVEEKSSYRWRVKNNTLYQLDQNGRETENCFTFDKVYDKDTETNEVFNDVAKPIVEAAIHGFNGTIFAYGQTSSGKTYTMSGTEESHGIIPLAVKHLFEKIKTIPDRDFLVRVSYIEIYNETLRDLLNMEKKNIKVHETHSGVKVDCTERVTSSPEEVLEAMKEGEANRQTGATNMNEESSRSHSIFQITIESREHIEDESEAGSVNVSQLNLVDLAGSERAGQTGATGLRFKEGTHINKSLSVLALVIKQLSEGPNRHANYRDSKLTRILQNSLGGNAKTSIICAITPASVEETVSTLQFANRAKAIKNKPEVNAVATNATMIQSLTKQLSRLQAELVAKRNLEVMLQSQKNVEQELQKQIVSLQKVILNGFGHSSSIDMSGARRKPQALRRVTISTVHHMEEPPIPQVPKFCTPSLKYNPLALSTEFVPIQNAGMLAPVPEETPMVTPPPTGKAVGFSDEVIEIDSDDETTTDTQRCSPYHSCYSSSKTPPCVLRKNAKQAEKNLKDIVELTKREKIYTPTVVELMEKLEQNRSVIAQLEEEITSLTANGKSKDSTIEELHARIKTTEDEVKSIAAAKLDLETKCKEYDTQITDWEVSYETLRNKSRNREKELLSLLEEHKTVKKHEDIGKLATINEREISNFMDMSKDISLVNSDNESSLTHNDDDASSQVQDLVTDIQSQLATKNQTILDLEANLYSHKQKIESLQITSQQLQVTIDEFKNKLAHVESENFILKSTVDSLNSTVESQKQCLESANKDIESYNSTIQELQIKLTKKDNLLNIKLNDSVLDNMIASEEKFIANNDNIKNIIHSLKIALDNRNKEIIDMKSTVQTNSELSSDNAALKEELDVKERQICTLIEEANKLQDQLADNITVINNLMKLEKDLANQLSATQEQCQSLNKLNEDNVIEVDNLRKRNYENEVLIVNLRTKCDELTNTVQEKETNERNKSSENQELTQRIESMSKHISDLEKDLNEKNDIITANSKTDSENQEYTIKLKEITSRLQEMLSKHGCTTEFHYETNDEDVNTVFSILEAKINNLESLVTHFIEEKNKASKAACESEEKLTLKSNTHTSEIAQLKEQVETLNRQMVMETEVLSEQVTQLTNDIDKLRIELDNKSRDMLDLEIKLNDAKENNENLRNDLASKENTISSLQENISSLYSQLDVFSQERESEMEKYQKSKESFDQIIQEKDSQIALLDEKLSSTKAMLEQKYIDMNAALKESVENRDKLMGEILKKASKLVQDYEGKNHALDDNCEGNVYEQVIITLDHVFTHITLLKTENDVERNEIAELLLKAQKQVEELTQRNVKLMNDYDELCDKNQTLLLEIERINILNKELLGTSELLNQLTMELQLKSSEIKAMESKVLEWNDHFKIYECVMKTQTEHFCAENEKLKNIQTLESIHQSALSDVVCESSSFETCQSVSENELRAPQTLSKICLNKVIDQLNDNLPYVTPSTSKSSIELQSTESQTETCTYIKLSLDLSRVKDENRKLTKELEKATDKNKHLAMAVKELELSQKYLLQEREDVRKEIELLLEPAQELQKKISNHKTNLSTLTATTYAENKLLNSQLKVLKHYHTRYIHVCQRDLPAFKTQLTELMTILKGSLLTDKQNSSFKRYSLPDILDNNTTMSTFKNESTLDGNLLMLDTNMTLTTCADSTLVGHDQTCLDVTQINFDAEVACQTNEPSKEMDTCIVLSQMETLSSDNQKLYERVESLSQENNNLKKEIVKLSRLSTLYKDADCSPIKINGTDSLQESICKNCNELRLIEEKLSETVKELSQELKNIKDQKDNLEQKYNSLSLETPSSDALVKKLSHSEKELQSRVLEINKLTNDLNVKNKTIRELQEENDSLSVQIMDSISEADNLKKELDNLKEENSEILVKYEELKHIAKDSNSKVNDVCPQCEVKDEFIKQLQIKQSEYSTLSRSLSDSDSSSRHNKICTLQNELHASKEDCKKITEEVVTIKNQLERSTISVGQAMDLDESMGDSNIFTFTKDFDTIETAKLKCSDSEERPLDVYNSDKIECLNYFVETIGGDKENLDSDVRIIDVMKMFYNKLVAKHGNEVENLLNKLKDYEELKFKLQSEVSTVNQKYAELNIEFEQNKNNITILEKVLSRIRDNINILNQEMSNVDDADKNTRLNTLFKENVLRILDFEFGLTCENIFESFIDSIYNKHQKDLSAITEQYKQLQSKMENVVSEFNTLNENIKEMKSQLSNKESEYNLLKAQKDKVFEISNAVTLDMVNKEKELIKMLTDGGKKLIELNIPCDIRETLSLEDNIKLLFESIINKNQSSVDKQILLLEIQNLKSTLDDKEKIVNNLNDKLLELDNNLQTQTCLHEDLTKIYENKVEENKANVHAVETLTKEIESLKQKLHEKENMIRNLENQVTHQKDVTTSSKEADLKELLEKLDCLKQDYENMKSINEMITTERDTNAAELEKAQEIINKNKMELDKMTSDILVLRESVNDNVCIIETLTLEAKSLMEQNVQLKQQFNDKTKDCARLEMNIKTHEKTAEIQSKMIMRLQKQKEDVDKSVAEKDRLLDEVTEKYTALQKECEVMAADLQAARESVERLRTKSEALEAKVSELEASRRLSGEAARRRRRSLHDSQRAFADDHIQDHNKVEAVFASRAKPDDLFMDVDEDHSSSRSTPVRLGRGRDSFSNRQDHSDKDEDSRASNVASTRRRRQSIHDLHRSLLRPAHDRSGRASMGLVKEETSSKPMDSSSDSEVALLRSQLTSCQQELEELREQYRELDDECETCAQYLREREDQCRALKREKAALEKQVGELNEKLKSGATRGQGDATVSYANASVNTDEDWTNLHSVVVDRMSFDAEVEKNKRLTRTIEELRCNKQQLKQTVAHMQRALDRSAAYKEAKELEATKAELSSCRQQLAELQQRCRELDEECETCGQYLREREDQCRRLRDAKHALEAKLQELQEDASSPHVSVSRRKRQSVHDELRRPAAADVATCTGDDLLSYQVERDDNSLRVNNAQAQELKQVKIALDKVLREKASLESQLAACGAPALYVATGSAIVQNQQITDVMKENQKLKKVNLKLVKMCQKRGKLSEANRENEEPSDLG